VIPERPYAVRPERLYTRDDLMQGWQRGDDHSMTLDGRIYEYVEAHGGRAPEVEEGLAQRTHDHFMDVALANFLVQTDRPVVGIMGGSSTLAAAPNYRRIVQIAAGLTNRGYLVVGGGGLGIMEAANLGAYLAARSDTDRDAAVDALSRVLPHENRAGYMRAADEVRERFSPGSDSLAIPTWMVRGEPISQFASHIAKYFSNSIREAGMLAVASAGIVFAPGGAGTMQEIFQDAAQNAYRSSGRGSMAFLDAQHYCVETGLYPTLQRQATRLGFAELLSIGDEPEQILDRFPPSPAPPISDGVPAEMIVRRMRNASLPTAKHDRTTRRR
jgi:predicted Rossmann-fold nucleotide-binding protein